MKDILKRASMVDCKPVVTHVSIAKTADDVATPYADPTQYRSLADALQYLTVTRPDLSYAVNLLCQHMHAPTTTDWASLKRVLRYIKGTLHFGLRISRSASLDIHAYSDSNWAGVARSSTEAEYKGLVDVSPEVTWFVSLLHEIGIPPASPPRLWCDNLGATYLCANPVFHAHTKHVGIDYHFVRDKVAKKELEVHFISTKDQLADIFTKSLSSIRFNSLRDKLNVLASQPCV
ncbi:PREDICTED: uncharacterized protein LOC109183991 [Ipomoea nil]|uniref:uncharacterized protein LOC109183991 n=1 Tax=Ipomoea nil TaxID=35883 RepID=UPI000901BC57|nr:PREDICTED: uncharacterized protein LOC109183991 [Ipomoea nil]